MPLPIPIGIDDFRTLRELDLAYVDKSGLIQEVIDQPGLQVILLPRPRRFGKSLNLSMLRWFFEKREEDLSPLFRDLAIWRAGEAYRAEFQRYPVITFNLKGTRSDSFELCLASIHEKIIDLYREHRQVLDGGRLDEVDRRRYQEVLDGTAPPELYQRALLDMSDYLQRHHGQKVVILIDEYDSPIHAAHIHGYAPKILDFMRAFLGAGLKSNPHLHRAVLTGILRIAKESLFSDVNNIGVYTLLAKPFNTCFGFTEGEVAALLDRSEQGDKLDVVRAWYNGYLFGGEVIYNPWSVMSFLVSGDGVPALHWVSTSSNDLVRALLERYAVDLEPVFEALLQGGSIERVLEDNVVLSELYRSEDALWSLLVFSGYLKAERRLRGPMERPSHMISIPNREVRELYRTTFLTWMRVQLGGRGGSLDKLTAALLRGDAVELEEQLQAFVTQVLSYHDPGSVDPERVYHAFVLGLLAAMEPAYLVRSNRESGEGRPDVMIKPRDPGKPAAVLELKMARRGKTAEAALREGLAQIRSRRYEAELRAEGASAVHAFALAFDGKRVWVKLGGGAAPKTKAPKTKAPKPAKKAKPAKKRASPRAVTKRR